MSPGEYAAGWCGAGSLGPRVSFGTYLDARRDASYKEHSVCRVQVKQGVRPVSHTLLDELLLSCGALTGHSQEDLPMATQPASGAQSSGSSLMG